MSNLGNYIEKKVVVLTLDSRMLVGKLESFDQLTNLVLSNTLERVIRTPDDPEDSETVPLGLYIVRGDNVCVVGLVDESIENEIDWSKVRGATIGTTKHS
ncbi:hypothetical protein G7054_g2200 [Neopestalotiopsis clavispora]|nr:hypothetical protein E8E14_005209 [Neopestalotiopsis sp. 37M]KAF7539395.1 hypothetical protein G7054_g2200 [Neopestalotiopsis clavispora]